jgi:TonB-linked SusC/RagA family outer membrane protein
MMKKILLCLVVGWLAIGNLLAQTRSVSGRIISGDDNSPLPGVSILVKGTTTGTTTNMDGRYDLQVPQSGVLVMSFVGFTPQEIIVGNRSTIDVVMQPDIKQLNEVVVTAIGIEREKKALGYGVQEVKGDQLAQKSEPNLINALQGKLTGVEIISGSGVPGSNTQIFIRGISSINGSQPLFIVDGIPIDNSNNVSNGGVVSGSAYSNRALDLNPNDIESMTVLKGPAAASLYGSRAANGAIIITTKRGKLGEGAKKAEITITSSYNIQTVNGLPKYQNDFGAGQNYRFNNAVTDSWGPRFGTPGFPGKVVNVAGNPKDSLLYQAYPNNVKDFFNAGRIIDNGVAVNGGGENTRYNFSANSTNQVGIVPNTGLDRLSLRASGLAKLNNNFSVDASVLFTNTVQKGGQQGNSGFSPWFTLPFLPRSLDLQTLPYESPSLPGVQFPSLFTQINRDNPVWSVNKNPYRSDVNRTISSATLNYNPAGLKELTITGRVGVDQYTDKRQEFVAFGSRAGNTSFGQQGNGAQQYTNYTYLQFNTDLFAVYQKDISNNFNLRVLAGSQFNQITNTNNQITAQNLVTPDFFNLSNSTGSNSISSNFYSRTRLLGFYSQLSLSYKDWAFLELTGRVDQSSTLPANNRTYFYPSITGSVVLTDALKINSPVLSYLKVRGNFARVGAATDAYQLKNLYVVPAYGNNTSGIDFPYAGNTVAFTLSNAARNPALQPEFKESYEAGVEVGLWKRRVNVDFNYFVATQKNQIFDVPQSSATGFTTRRINSPEFFNYGIELGINADVIKSGRFTWNTAVNFTRIRNQVAGLAPGVQASYFGPFNFATYLVGSPIGVLTGTTIQRYKNEANPNDPNNGKAIIDGGTGQPFVDRTPNQVIGNPNPDWSGGFINTFRYGGFALNVVIQHQQGGVLYSRQTQIARLRGALQETSDRERPYMFEGIIATGTNTDGTTRYTPNSIQLTGFSYWTALNNYDELAVFDATNIRLREITLSYEIPKKWLEKSPIGAVNLSLSGRNLFFYAPNLPHADPETNLGTDNARGVEFNSPPSVRNYGVNLRVTF